MQRRQFTLSAALITSLGLAACSREESAAGAQTEATPIAPAQAYDVVAAEGRGFTVGALMSAQPVYVLFDPQCPHCGHLWNATLPLHAQAKFVWLPVAFISAKSLPQGAALLQASDPAQAMNAHEQSLLAGNGGTAASADIPAEVEARIRANTQLLNRLGAESVPFIVARHRSSGAVIAQPGAMDTPALTQLLGLAG